MKAIRWLHGEVKTPPMSVESRREFGFLLRMLQEGVGVGMPHSRPMPSVGTGCHELRVKDAAGEWRLLYALTTDAVVVLDVFQKKSRATPDEVIDKCRRRLRDYRRDIP